MSIKAKVNDMRYLWKSVLEETIPRENFVFSINKETALESSSVHYKS